jgi:uncharacterized protein
MDKMSTYDGPTWDAHLHIMPPERTAGLVRWMLKAFPEHQASQDITPDEIIGDLASVGITRAFNFVFPLREEETEPLNLFNREIGRSYPQLVPFGSMHIETPDKGEAAERFILEYGLAGIKLHPYAQRFEAFCREFEPMYARLDQLGKPLFVHTGFDAFYGRTQDLAHLETILSRFPRMQVVMVHSLFPRFRLARELVSSHENAWLDMTNSLSMVKWYRALDGNPWSDHFGDEPEAEMGAFEPLVDEFSEKILFGTDHPVGMGTIEQIYDDLESFGFSDKVKMDLTGRSALALLKKTGWTP